MLVFGILLVVAAAIAQGMGPMAYESENKAEGMPRHYPPPRPRFFASIEIDIVEEFPLPKSYCRGVLLTPYSIVTGPDCVQERDLFYVRYIASEFVDEYASAQQVFRSERINDPYFEDFSIILSDRRLTYGNYRFLTPRPNMSPFSGLARICRTAEAREFEEEVRQVVGVPYSVCDQTWQRARKYATRMAENITETQ